MDTAIKLFQKGIDDAIVRSENTSTTTDGNGTDSSETKPVKLWAVNEKQ